MTISVNLSRETPAPNETGMFVKFLLAEYFLPAGFDWRALVVEVQTDEPDLHFGSGGFFYAQDGRWITASFSSDLDFDNKVDAFDAWISASAKAVGRPWKAAKIQIMRHGAVVDVKLDFNFDDVEHWQRHDDDVLLGDFLRPPELPTPIGPSVLKTSSKQ